MVYFKMFLFFGLIIINTFSPFNCESYLSSYRMYVPKENKFEMYRRCRYHICVDPPDYPEEEIDHIMSDKNSVGLFGVVLNSTYDKFRIDTRGDVLVTKQPLCKNTLRAEFAPRVMKNKEGIWKTVVNVEGHRQIFSAEMCPDTTERDEKTSLCYYSFNYRCKQSYQNMFLLVYENGKIDFDDFFVPTICNCVSD